MYRVLKKTNLFIFMAALLVFEMFFFEVPVSAKAKSISAPKISAKKYNKDAGIKVNIKKTKKAEGYEIYVCPVKTVSLYEGYVNSFYVEGIPYDSLAGSWHEQGKFYQQADVKSTGKKTQSYCIKYVQPGTYKVKVKAYYTKSGKRVYSKYSKTKTITIGPAEGGNGLKKEYDFSSLNVGDEFEFGSYEQDGNLTNGYEPIKWLVLSKNDDNIFILSKYALDILPYNKDYNEEVTWENSTLRKWLNENFYKTAFNESERKLIKEMSISNENNTIYGTSAGNTTSDKLIILSQQDLVNTAYGFSSSYDDYDVNRRCAATEYAFNSGLWMFNTKTTSEGSGSCFWWTRTPGHNNGYVTYVHDFGCLYSDGNMYDTGYVHCSHGIRPAMFIKLDKPLSEGVKIYTYNNDEFIAVKNLSDKYCFKQETGSKCTLASANMVISLYRNEVYKEIGWGSAGCTWMEGKKAVLKTGYTNSTAQEKRNVAGNMVTNGIPSVIRLGDDSADVGHSVVVVGIRKNANFDNVTDNDLLIIDPADAKIKVLIELKSGSTWHGGINGGLDNNTWSLVIPAECDWEGFSLKK